MLTLVSPAKINLFLKVVGRRPDGFHELASLFQAIDLHDILHFELAEIDHLQSTNKRLPTDRSNLVWKAVDLFRSKTGLHFGLKVIIDKHIPIEAGLGGGSSNAATALWAVNQLMGKPATEKELQTWAGEIGSDVSFFFSTGTAYCTGRGEIVQPLAQLTPQPIWIFKPNFGISTPQVYRHVNLSKLCTIDPKQALDQFISGNPIFFNDLEEPALSLMPELNSFKQDLLNLGFKTVMLSGSGSSFVCMHGEPTRALDTFQVKVNYLNRASHSWYLQIV